MTSGALYPLVPYSPSRKELVEENPKSPIFMLNLLSRNIFSAFMSRWHIPFLWHSSIPFSISENINLDWFSLNPPKL